MTSFLPRFATLGAIAAAASLSFAPASAAARATGFYYTVDLAQPVAEKTVTVAGGVAWACKGTTCVARKGSSRPLRLCRQLQREHGEIVAFTADEKTLDADKLAQCNG